eukprot:13762294-Alexandrium_andersonii.AAC.1
MHRRIVSSFIIDHAAESLNQQQVRFGACSETFRFRLQRAPGSLPAVMLEMSALLSLCRALRLLSGS